ncbi:hypothetical protein CVT25_015607 [Psilocybe cyanescens]|uniref:Sfi1 spindle body domain-containing protein n=1 Tax=Psilocybe cyanescens TaxID=93625 RepID=A0A409WHT7_PSICY|nr:hypothetical protein CVT25_015607 [Psilocybe cyanescens]
MHRFQPTRASPPIKSSVLSNSTRTEPSVAVAPELQHLSPEDIDILDTVIDRAGPSATTFFKIFKAYSDVLKERGLDPQEVVYYGKLLKLGNLKGKDWGEKWKMVKAQAELTPNTPMQSFQSESDTHHPFLSQTQTGLSEISYDTPNDQPKRPTLWVSAKRNYASKTDSREMSSISAARLPSKGMTFDLESTIASDDVGNFSPVPPPYKSTAISKPLSCLVPSKPNVHSIPPKVAPRSSNIPKDNKKPVDPDDVWKNIQMERDEKAADKFREDKLIRRYVEMWRQGLSWILTTHKQVADARDKIDLKMFMQRWQNRVNSRKVAEDELVNQFQRRNVKGFFKTWQTRLKQRRQAAWRNDMRHKMKLVKNKSDNRLKQDVWAKWRLLQLSHRADKHYQTTLLARHHGRWKGRLIELDNLDVIADDFSEHIYLKSLKLSWNLWKQAASLRRDQNIITQRVDCRIVATAFDLWRKRIAQARLSDTFKDKMVMKRTMQKWKQSQTALKALGHRADKHLARQDDLLCRAIIRIWRARMRGKKYEEFRTTQDLKNAWQKWLTKMAKQNARMDDAAVHFNRTNSRLVGATVSRWRQVLKTHQNAQAYAVNYDRDRLHAKVLFLWRLRLREQAQSAKVARWANRFFATRRAWNVWIMAMEERKRQERLKLWNLAKAQKFLNVWRRRTMHQQYLKECERVVQDRRNKRILFGTLTHWTNRVIELKSRELDVAHRHSVSLQSTAFKKWKFCQRKHAEEISLLENYLLVKREDILKRAFVRWMTAKRSIEHRRSTHQRKEAQLRQLAITSAWEKWRERFKEERLRPLEYTVIIDNQKSALSQAFRLWLSKTDSLPAVRFHSKHLKEKFFRKWRDAMPNALRAKKAREIDTYNTLAKTFERWTQAYKTKTTLKAVARAKYLRLPAANSRPAIMRSRPLYTGTSDIFTRRTPRGLEDNESQVSDTRVEPLKEAFIPRARTARSPKPRSERSVVRSEYGASVARQPSPVRSIVSMPDRHSKSPSFASLHASPVRSREGGGKLWSALKDINQNRRPRNL